jgi:hypothetical protein
MLKSRSRGSAGIRIPSKPYSRMPMRKRRSTLRHPTSPGLSLAGVRLAIVPGHVIGLPVLHQSSSCTHAVVNTPAETLGACFAHFPRAWQPSPC